MTITPGMADREAGRCTPRGALQRLPALRALLLLFASLQAASGNSNGA
jgi:hypothetical protein